MFVTGIILGRPYNTQLDGDGYAMCVSGHLPVTPLHCVAEVCVTPEKYQFISEGCPSSVVNNAGYGNSSCGEW